MIYEKIDLFTKFFNKNIQFIILVYLIKYLHLTVGISHTLEKVIISSKIENTFFNSHFANEFSCNEPPPNYGSY